MLACCLLWLSAVISLSPLAAQTGQDCPTVPLERDINFQVNLGEAACAFSDESREMGLRDILSNRQGLLFAPVPGGLVDFGFSSGRLWVQVRLKNATDETGTWWVTHDIPVARTLNVHLIPENGGADAARELLALTDRDRFGARPIAHRHLVSEVTLLPNETVTLVVDYTSAQATEMPLFAESVPLFFKRTQAENVEIIALTALVLGMGLISTVYLFGLTGRPAFAYGSYVLSGVALLVHMEGYAFQFIWPNWPALNQVALPVIATTFVALGTFFVDRFTQSASHNPKLHLIAVALIVILGIVALLAPLLVAADWFKFFLLATILLGTMMQVILAVTAMHRRQSGARLLVLGFGALAASISFGVIGYLTEGLFEQEIAGRAIRFGFLVEAAAFSAAIALRVRATRAERDASLKEQLRLFEDRLNLSEALRRAEEDRQRASRAAERSQEALASTAHDIRQPLAALQMALSDGSAEPDQFARSLEYLDDIVRSGLENHSTPLGTGDRDPPSSNARERFSANVVLKNIDAMFVAEAAQKAVKLNVVDCSAYIIADPLALMRIVGNLVSNALQHATPQRIVVGCRRVSGGICFEVHDNGNGISKQELERILKRGHKGPESEGHGLGLAIISDLATVQGFHFELTSTPAHGTVARVLVPNPAAHRSDH